MGQFILNTPECIPAEADRLFRRILACLLVGNTEVISILAVLGMNDQRNLIFPKQNERYESGRMVVVFSGRDGSKVIQCAISNEALEDHFESDGKNLLKVFQANRKRIEHEARRKYLAGSLEPDNSILLKTSDIG